MSRKLIVNDGRRQRELLIVSKIVVGRDPTCDLSEADPLLSRRHAEFSIEGDDIVVRDLGSRNGIYLNGARVAEGTLQSGDIIRIGHLQMRYLEDAAPLVSMPELIDDATGLVLPGPRGPATARPPSVVAPRPASASGAMPKPAPASGALPRPTPPQATPRPVAPVLQPRPAPAGEDDADVTAYLSPSASAIQRARAGGASGSAAKVSPPLPNPPAIDLDQVEQTRVVPAPGRTGLRPKPQPLGPAPGEHTSVMPPPSPPTAVQPPNASGALHTAVLPPPAPPAEDIDEPTSVVLTPRPRTRVEPALSKVEGPAAAPAASTNHAREARALAMAVDAIAAFLGSAAVGRGAADAVKTLERDLASGTPPAELVAALKGLAARLGAAANELT